MEDHDDHDVEEEEEEEDVVDSCSVDCEVPAWQCRLSVSVTRSSSDWSDPAVSSSTSVCDRSTQ